MNNIYQYKILKAGEIIPEGWIRAQLDRDLTVGYTGRFDRVHPTVSQDVFIKQNRSSKSRVGFRKEWWSGEHEGYWKDAVTRMAFLTGNREYSRNARQWINDIVDNAGKDGYIGIYADGNLPNHRFRHTKGDGELWTISRILMAMLAYYEYTGEEKILDAAEKTVLLVMSQYRERNYFSRKSIGGGKSHGIGFFESLEWLYRITEKTQYLQFAGKLYRDFNEGRVRDDDLKTARLLDESRLFQKHGAHIAEGLFVPAFIASMDDSPELQLAAANVLKKLSVHLTPGGAMRCDEWIKGKAATADERYEYCGIAEMISPLNKIISITGNTRLADIIETMVFNAGQGARFPVLSALSYLSTDNRININHWELGKRETYDAVHLAASCCVLNGSRLMPYYVEGMWMKDMKEDGLTAMLFGPCKVHTIVKGIPLYISEQTSYPFTDHILFELYPAKPVSFSLTLRKPHGSAKADVTAPDKAEVTEDAFAITIKHLWKHGDVVKVDFQFGIKQVTQPGSATVQGKGIYLKRGPLVFAFPFDYKATPVREYRNSGFHRYRIKALDKAGWKYKIMPGEKFEFIPSKIKNILLPWDKAVVKLKGSLVGKKSEKIPVELVPMGNTVFRRVTFSVFTNNQ